MTDDHLTVLVQILAELRRIRQAVEPRPQPANEAALLSKLLPAIGGRFGSNPFRTKELFEDPAIAELLRGFSSGKAGCLLAKFAGIPVEGYLLDRVSTEHSAALWVVSKLP